jgi:hypothetical protein
MKKTYAFLQETYKRLSNLEKTIFINAIIDRYLSNIDILQNLKIS